MTRGSPISRRGFLGGLTATSMLVACSAEARVPEAPRSASPTASPTTSPSATRPDVMGLALLGAGGHGTVLARRLVKDSRVRVVAVCDPDSARARRVASLVASRSAPGRAPATFSDPRAVLDLAEVTAVVIATPHHWHVLAAVWAMAAGKHVYLEKPATRALSEGASLISAWQRSGLVLEVGTQRRSHPGLQEAIAALHDGAIGDVALARCFSWKRRPPIGPAVRGSWPATLDPETWFGPRPVVRPTRRRFHYDWHWFTDFGNGGLGNNGVHRLDVARWGMGLEGIGDHVVSLAGRLGPADAGQTPNTALTVVSFGDRAVVHDLRGRPASRPAGMTATDEVVFIGDAASLVVSRTGGRLLDDRGATVKQLGGDARGVDPIARHLRGWVSAVLAEDPAAVRVGPLAGVGGAALCHSAAAVHAAASSDPGSSGSAAVARAREGVLTLAGPSMAAPLEHFLAHAGAQQGALVASPVRQIRDDRVAGAPERITWREGYHLPDA